MIYPTTRIVFDRKHVSSNTKKGLVQLEVLYKRMRKYFSTGVKVTKNNWSSSGKVTRCRERIVMNQRIYEMKGMVDKYIVDLMENGEPFDFDKFKAWMSSGNDCGPEFVDRMEKRITERNDIRHCTKSSYMERNEAIIKRLAEIIKATHLSKHKFSIIANISNIGRKLCGEMKITESDISKICRTYDVNYDWFKYGVGEVGNIKVNENGSNTINFMVPKAGETKDAQCFNQVLSVLSNIGRIDPNNHNSIEIASLKETINCLNSIIDAKNLTIRALKKMLGDNGIKI